MPVCVYQRCVLSPPSATPASADLLGCPAAIRHLAVMRGSSPPPDRRHSSATVSIVSDGKMALPMTSPLPAIFVDGASRGCSPDRGQPQVLLPPPGVRTAREMRAKRRRRRMSSTYSTPPMSRSFSLSSPEKGQGRGEERRRLSATSMLEAGEKAAQVTPLHGVMHFHETVFSVMNCYVSECG